MSSKRKASSALEADGRVQKKAKGQPPSSLVPIGERTKAIKGQKNPDMLHMLCVDTRTGKRKELHFKKLVHAEIDWDNAEHIAKINSWRNQLYGRAGLKAKDVCMWNADEESWLELYFHLIIAQGTKEGLMIPRAKDVLDDFNNFFVGRVFKNKLDEDQEPRKPRQHNAFVSKMNRVVQHLKNRLEYMMLGKSGDYYRPEITKPMLSKYMELKKELVISKMLGNGETMSWEVDYEAGDEWADNKHWKKFWEGIQDLPSLIEDEELDDKFLGDSSDEESLCGNESTFVDGDTGVTTPECAIKGVAVDKISSDFGNSPLGTDTINLSPTQKLSKTEVAVATEDGIKIETQETIIGDESEAVDALISLKTSL